MRNTKMGCCLVVLLACAAPAAPADEPLPTIAETTAALDCQSGFVPLCWDGRNGKLFLEVERLEEPFLHIISLASGLGANRIGLDRGYSTRGLVHFRRVGPRVLLVQENTRYRASAGSEALKDGVRAQFATSVLAGWQVEAEQDGRVLVDATDFFLSDTLGLARQLKSSDQGDFSVVSEHSVLHLPRTRAFPRNTEVEALLTLRSANPGDLVRQTAPAGTTLTLRLHHSLVALPEEPLAPRRFDPRVGMYPLTFQDYAQPMSGRLQQRWIVRWRLQGRKGRADRPIVYHLDPAMPEPVRSAVREGALWWNGVLERVTGLREPLQVKDLPDDADPMDARYSIIQWGHRMDRGWSWGDAIMDPRSGEILRAVLFMDSHRMRSDHNLWSGLNPATDTGAQSGWTHCRAGAWGVPDWAADLDPDLSAQEFVLARIRQLAAHEVGHTLGLAHNFAASTYDGRASVMDYPAPLLRVEDGDLDLSQAYRPGTGAYDEFAIRYGYSPFAPKDEEAGLAGIVEQGLRDGMIFLSDRDARPPSASDARAQLWDNRSEPLAELRNALQVRRVLLDRFNDVALAEGEPLSLLEERLAPVYFHHRFALEATSKLVGGMEYAYAVRGDGQQPTRWVDASIQRQALGLLLQALQPEALALPLEVLERLAPKAFGYEANTTAEEFRSHTWPAFDELGAARTLAASIVDAVLQRNRAARLVAFGAHHPAGPGLTDVVQSLLDATWHQAEPRDPRLQALSRVAERVVLDRLLELATDAEATVEVRAVAEWALSGLAAGLEAAEAPDAMGAALQDLALRDIQRFFGRTDDATGRSTPLPAPPGSPIGDQR